MALKQLRAIWPECKLEGVWLNGHLIAGRDTMAGEIFVPAEKVLASYNTFGEGNGTKNRNNR